VARSSQLRPRAQTNSQRDNSASGDCERPLERLKGGRLTCSKRVFWLAQLNGELLVQTFLTLSPREASRASQVCRSWQQTVRMSCRLTSRLELGQYDCPWRRKNLGSLFKRYCSLEELHFCTEFLLPLEAVQAISKAFSQSLRSFTGFLISNCVEGKQVAISELAKISTLESLTLEGTLISGHSLVELADNCPNLRSVCCHEILATHSQLAYLWDRCPNLSSLSGVNLSVHNELDGVAREPASLILSQLSSLNSLGLNLFTEYDPQILDCISKLSFSNLTSLRLRACTFPTEGVLNLFTHCTRLESLSLVASEIPGCADEVFRNLSSSHLPCLKSLDLDEDQISDRGLAALARHPVAMHLTALECLDLKNASRSTFFALMGSLSSLSRLRVGVARNTPWLQGPSKDCLMLPNGSCGEFLDVSKRTAFDSVDNLAVCWCDDFGLTEVEEIQPRCKYVRIGQLGEWPNLSHLELCDWPALSSMDAAIFASRSRKIKRFTLSLPHELSSDTIRVIAKNCRDLEMFRLFMFSDSMSLTGVNGKRWQQSIKKIFSRWLPFCQCSIHVH